VQLWATIQGYLPAFATQIGALLTQIDNDHSSQNRHRNRRNPNART
jgi:hypothetical protein